ncbi:putative autotransporter adhesin-like protein [Lutibacter sp. Hel_I_33_5]|uniref:head GIN domain-containing protein n=1 Tax=Lutibacter sp. Hel_I_33_5 TaxID=1566289 RepID=UPI0011A90653|nr:head GIN domain-containing protein [Lutibacter sp. Hel_I_33_5]TVZ57356.1 putative autotransporter adhesin-like protein [Lutibacter sp. Hel_I_33_5]
MKFKMITFLLCLLFLNNNINAQKTIKLTNKFDKIIVSPHIEAEFIKGKETSVQIEDINVPVEKFKYELKNGTLQVYLEGAKTYTKSKKIVYRNRERKVPLYKNRVAKVIITYANVDTFSLRGEEKNTFTSALDQEKCTLRIYGKSEVTINEIDVEKLNVSIYGESFLNIEKGTINRQKITAYGASKVMAFDVVTNDTKITAYGDGTFQLNATDRIKVSSYGEATVLYKGGAELKKGLIIGESKIRKLL